MTTSDPQPPNDVAAEAAFLGALMLSPAAVDQAIDLLTVDELYRPAHQTIYTAILDLYSDGDPVDPISVCDRLDRDGDLLRCGGAPYLHTVIADLPTAVNVAYYAEIVSRKAIQRRAIELGWRITQTAWAWPDSDGLTERVETLASGLVAREDTSRDIIDLDGAVDEALERIAGPVPPAIPTGLHDLDDILAGGLRNGAVYVVAARPGMGKSLTGAGIGLHVAQHTNIGVLICSLEMGRDEITNRILANMSGVDLTSITTHQLCDLDWARLRKARDQFRRVPLLIRDTPHLTSVGLRRIAERLTRGPKGLGLIVVDYAQQMTAADARLPREQQVAEISRSTKRLALHLGIPIILLAQTNRKSADRATPDPSDLRESGALEADADVVIILRLPSGQERAGELDAFIVKNRHGRTGVVTVAWSPHYARVRSLLRDAS